MSERPIAILGAGMAGLGAAHRFHGAGVEPVVYEACDYAGGHATTLTYAGDFVLDRGLHVSFTADRRLQELFASNVGGDYVELSARLSNYWRGHVLKHPVQCNLYGLPEPLVAAVIRDMAAVAGSELPAGGTFAQWLYAAYGKTFAETFPMVYGRKYHTTEMSNLTTDWLGPRMYRPRMDEVLLGASGAPTADVHYVGKVRYPRRGGFLAFVRPFVQRSDIRFGHRLIAIDARAKTLRFANGAVAGYRRLLSSLPLPTLVPLIEGSPRAVLAAAQRLAYTSCVLVNIGVARSGLGEGVACYVYDPEIVFSRLSYPHALGADAAPPGQSVVQCEVYFSDKYRPFRGAPADLIDPVIADLRRIGLLHDGDTITLRDAALLPFANVVFDLERGEALACVNAFLAECDIQCAGRFGEWGHHWTDQAFLSGESAAQRILDSGC